MAGNTKERILDAALELFSQKGYAGTNIQGIADEVGIVKSALYRYFDSKEAIWNALLERMTIYYYEHFCSEENLPSIPTNTEELSELTMGMVNFTIRDEKLIRVRKLLQIEQFRDERARELASRHFLTDLEALYTAIFTGMIKNGSLKEYEPGILAFAYVTPITALIHLRDREPDRIAEVIERIRLFVTHFISVYGANN